MTREETLRALADGKRVRHLRCGEWRNELSADDYAALLPAAFSPELWRIAPEPVPPGDLTYEEAVELKKQGAELEWRYVDWAAWAAVTSDLENPAFTELRRRYAYRRKPTTSPVQWRPCDVPPVCWLRSDTSRSDGLVVAVAEDGVFTEDGFHTFHELADPRWSHSTDRRTWRPCSKEASD